MSKRLNDRQIEPANLARLGDTLEGTVDLAVMHRLSPLLLSSEGAATVTLQFAVDANGQPGIRGHVVATLQMMCQRCLAAMQVDINAAVSLGIVVSPEQARDLPANYEPLLVGEEPVLLAALVEEELLLAMPIVAMHAPEECGVAALPPGDTEAAGPAPTGDAEAKRKNPFAVLEGLRRNR